MIEGIMTQPVNHVATVDFDGWGGGSKGKPPPEGSGPGPREGRLG